MRKIFVSSLEDWMIEELTRNNKVDWQLTTTRYFLPEGVAIPVNNITLDQLSQEDAPDIMEISKYKHFFTEEYLKDRIERSFTAGVRMNGKLAAWALTHDDGAIGALHILDEIRNRGFALEIIFNLSHQIRKNGNLPIAQF